MSLQTPILDYAKPTPWWRRRRARNFLALTAAFAAIIWVGPSRIGHTARHAWLLYWQERCLAHAIPSDRAVFTSARGERAPSSPTCWKAFSQQLPNSTGAAGASGRSGAIVFLHGRDNTEGDERLIAVEVTGAVRRAGHCDLHLRARTVGLGSWRSAPIDGGWQSDVVSVTDPGDAAGPLRVFAAQPDPKDRESFSIALELGGRRSVIRASMCGDYVVFEAERGAH